jgi:protein-tyrosine phosphatase
MIDFHSHVIPYLDDGSNNINMSLDMLKNAVLEGTEYICATSHYIPGDAVISRQIYEEKLIGINELIKFNNIDIKVLPALELYMHPDLPKLYKEKLVWGINDNKYLLIELPMQQFPIYTEEVLYELRLMGAHPIIAHPERNLRIMKDVSLLINLVEHDTLAQVNSGSLRGIYGKNIKVFAEKLIDMNLVHLIGSDAHNDRSRTTKIRDAYEIVKHRNKELYQWIIDNELNIITGADVEILDIENKSKNIFLFNLFRR